MDLTATNRALAMVQAASSDLGLDTTLRQLQIFLYVATTADSGIDAGTLERKTGSSQAAVSRALTKLGPTPGNLGLIQYDVDPADRRRVYAKVSLKGRKVLDRMLRQLSAAE